MQNHSLYIDCLFDGIRNGNQEVITTLLNLYQLDINDNSSFDEYFATPLHIAVDSNNENIIQLIISLGGDVNGVDYYGETPLYRAVSNGYLNVIQTLLDSGADVYFEAYGNKNLNTSLVLADSFSDRTYYNLLLPFTKGHRNWKKVRTIAKVYGSLIKQYHASVENVWKPYGTGYYLCKEHFDKSVIYV